MIIHVTLTLSNDEALFTLEGESWLGNAQSPCDELGTGQNGLGLNLYVVPPTSCVVTISEDGLGRSCKERSKVHYH